jgi:hypothetical protein
VAGRLHLRSRHGDVSEPGNPQEAYTDGPGGPMPPEGTTARPEAATGDPAVVDNRGRSGVTRDRGTVYRASDQARGAKRWFGGRFGLGGLAHHPDWGVGLHRAVYGPTFGSQPNAPGSRDWTWHHSLLYLIPGAVTVGMAVDAGRSNPRGCPGPTGAGGGPKGTLPCCGRGTVRTSRLQRPNAAAYRCRRRSSATKPSALGAFLERA